MSKLPMIVYGKPQLGLTIEQERWLLDNHNFHVANTGNDSRQLCIDYPEAKFIFKCMGWHHDVPERYEAYRTYWGKDHINLTAFGNNNVYFFDAGVVYDLANPFTTIHDRAGTDEPGSRGIIPAHLRSYSYGRAVEQLRWARMWMPELKTVVTHPYHIINPKSTDPVQMPTMTHSDVWCVHIGFLLRVSQQGGPPDGVELWAYITDGDIRIRTEADLEKIGGEIRKHNCTALFMCDDDDLPELGRMTPAGIRPTDKALALWKGLDDG